MDKIKVKMFGGFTVSWKGKTVSEENTRSKKALLLLAYLIYNRSRRITAQNLTELLWSEPDETVNPQGALKTMVHRMRNMFEPFGEKAGYDLIVSKGTSYSWNEEYEIEYDVETFDALCEQAQAENDPEKKLEKAKEAIAAYSGDFLPKFSMESWVMPISAYYNGLYVETVRTALSLLEEKDERTEMISVCENALKADPYNEEIYEVLLRSLLLLGKRSEVISNYEKFFDQMTNTFGIAPGDELRDIYHKAVSMENESTITWDDLNSQIREKTGASGAMICDYDFFKAFYHLQARSITRTGDSIHIGLFTVSGKNGATLPKRSLQNVMENLETIIQTSLRRGDVASQCSSTQYVVMLQQANHENSCMVFERIIRAYYRQYPHTPAELRFSIQPMVPYN